MRKAIADVINTWTSEEVNLAYAEIVPVTNGKPPSTSSKRAYLTHEYYCLTVKNYFANNHLILNRRTDKAIVLQLTEKAGDLLTKDLQIRAEVRACIMAGPSNNAYAKKTQLADVLNMNFSNLTPARLADLTLAAQDCITTAMLRIELHPKATTKPRGLHIPGLEKLLFRSSFTYNSYQRLLQDFDPAEYYTATAYAKVAVDNKVARNKSKCSNERLDRLYHLGGTFHYPAKAIDPDLAGDYQIFQYSTNSGDIPAYIAWFRDYTNMYAKPCGYPDHWFVITGTPAQDAHTKLNTLHHFDTHIEVNADLLQRAHVFLEASVPFRSFLDNARFEAQRGTPEGRGVYRHWAHIAEKLDTYLTYSDDMGMLTFAPDHRDIRELMYLYTTIGSSRATQKTATSQIAAANQHLQQLADELATATGATRRKELQAQINFVTSERDKRITELASAEATETDSATRYATAREVFLTMLPFVKKSVVLPWERTP